MNPSLKAESIYIPVTPADRLHLKRWHVHPDGPPALLLHGAIENGRIFYSETGKGFAPYLARNGFDVYVADLRGRGLSSPPIGPSSSFSQTDSILEDIPAFMAEIIRRKGRVPQHWVAHSWGGVLLLSAFARLPESERRLIASMAFFATKRCVRAFNFERIVKIDLFWKWAARLLVKIYGYLPAKEWGIGPDNESDLSHLQSKIWVKPSPWVDSQDGFDYAATLGRLRLPPTLYLAGAKDACLGHPRDVADFIRETGDPNAVFRLLGLKNGNRKDYGHIDILTDPLGEADHFPATLEWIRKHAGQPSHR